MSFLFDTARLRVRMMTPEDAPFVLQLFNAPNWLQFLPDRHVRTVEAARDYITDVYLKSYRDNGFGAAVVTLKESGEPIGICGLFQRTYLPVPDLGYAFLPAHEGKGYAAEAAGGMLDYLRPAQPDLRAVVSSENTRSVHLLEKLGFQYMEKVRPPGEDRMVLVYKAP
ncbi:GNAT family N-acetyltransferase [Dinghuibacter silviterrae]|nr:GNAT family N-acetyltransferase [Dinghuibacter silviterrae]